MYYEENLRKMTQCDELGCIYSDIIMPLKFFISYTSINNCIVSVEGRSIILYIKCLGGMFLREIFLKSGTI